MISVSVKSNIELKKILIDYNKTLDENTAGDYVSKIGLYPFVIFNGLILDYKRFINFKISSDEFLPKLEMTFKDYSNKMFDSLFPLDDSIISVFLKSPSESLKPIRMDFKIVEFNPIKNGLKSQEIIYKLVGLLDVSALYFTSYGSYRGTSYDVTKQICTEIGIGFASNIQNTNDAQTWINPADKKIIFLQSLAKASYKNDTAFILSYIDLYYNLNFIDIERQFADSTANLKGIMNDSTLIKDGNEELKSLFLTNHPDAASSNIFITRYNILNESTQVNLEIGYFGEARYYKKIERELDVYTVDALSDIGNSDTIVLKSNSDTDTDNLNNFGGMHIFYGTIDTDNMHENYHYAMMLNHRNLNFFQKVRMKVILSQPNFNLYRFQMIKVKL